MNTNTKFVWHPLMSVLQSAFRPFCLFTRISHLTKNLGKKRTQYKTFLFAASSIYSLYQLPFRTTISHCQFNLGWRTLTGLSQEFFGSFLACIYVGIGLSMQAKKTPTNLARPSLCKIILLKFNVQSCIP